jgi:hypothetical protein
MRFGRPGFLSTAMAVIVGCAGCASWPPGVKYDVAGVARRLGFPRCRVSVPLSEAQVIDAATHDGNPHPEQNHEWMAIVGMIQPRDQLRAVDCPRKTADPYFYALFRNGAEIARFHSIILD